MIVGQRDPPRRLAARGRMRAKHDDLVEALDGKFDDHHGELAGLLLVQIAFLNDRIAALGARAAELTAAIPAARGREPGRDHRPARRRHCRCPGALRGSVLGARSATTVNELGLDRRRPLVGDHQWPLECRQWGRDSVGLAAVAGPEPQLRTPGLIRRRHQHDGAPTVLFREAGGGFGLALCGTRGGAGSRSPWRCPREFRTGWGQ